MVNIENTSTAVLKKICPSRKKKRGIVPYCCDSLGEIVLGEKYISNSISEPEDFIIVILR